MLIFHETKYHRRECFDIRIFDCFDSLISRMVRRRGKPSRKGDSSGVVLCLMRLAFFVMIILLIVLALVTTVYYVLDIVFQSGCRTAHNDQPYLINLVTGIF